MTPEEVPEEVLQRMRGEFTHEDGSPVTDDELRDIAAHVSDLALDLKLKEIAGGVIDQFNEWIVVYGPEHARIMMGEFLATTRTGADVSSEEGMLDLRIAAHLARAIKNWEAIDES